MRYDDAMRRFPAILLLALFSFSLFSSAFSSDSDANLPACCRRGGRHHCSMAMRTGVSQTGPAFKESPCPLYPQIVLYSGSQRAARISTAYSSAPPDIWGGVRARQIQSSAPVLRVDAHRRVSILSPLKKGTEPARCVISALHRTPNNV